MENIKKRSQSKWKLYVSPLLLILTIFLGSCDTHNNHAKKDYVGTFQLDWSKSDTSSYLRELQLYKPFRLTLLANDSFYFSAEAPFVRKTSGMWQLKFIDGFYYAHLIYDTTEYGVIDDQIAVNEDGSLYVNSLRSRKGKPNLKYVVFKRVNSNVPRSSP